MTNIIIRINNNDYLATLNKTDTAQSILSSLPIKGRIKRWGEEIYFSIPLVIDECPDAKTEVEVGDLAYWPPGQAFCVFFGSTPYSQADKPVAASPVNVFGSLLELPSQLFDIKDNAQVEICLA
ncbi:cyclophilin-like fold protein [Photobacterium nomapromontoriensis]|uniref:cyclophilin-like fold protein n=1 Tax=Photobacterium nomapromontoriensis TaxID=2910237 RepID=UPI003D0E9DAB